MRVCVACVSGCGAWMFVCARVSVHVRFLCSFACACRMLDTVGACAHASVIVCALLYAMCVCVSVRVCRGMCVCSSRGVFSRGLCVCVLARLCVRVLRLGACVGASSIQHWWWDSSVTLVAGKGRRTKSQAAQSSKLSFPAKHTADDSDAESVCLTVRSAQTSMTGSTTSSKRLANLRRALSCIVPWRCRRSRP